MQRRKKLKTLLPDYTIAIFADYATTTKMLVSLALYRIVVELACGGKLYVLSILGEEA